VSRMKPSTDPPKKILVITVDESIGEIVVSMLQTAGYECGAARGHEETLNALTRASDYDLVFCQVAALEKEEEFLKWALGIGSGIPMVTTAGRTPGYIPRVILERGRFLQMPFEREQLLTIIEETLARAVRNTD
jgi:DNA-binding NtrC family response regulator